MKSNSGRGRLRLFRLAAILFGLGFGLAMVEIGFRLLGIGPPHFITKRFLRSPNPAINFFCYPSNPNQEFAPVPPVDRQWKLLSLTLPARQIPLNRISETPWCIEYRISQQGLRDRDYGPPEPGVLRIAGVGDSFAAGEGVPFQLSLFKQMEGLLGSGYEIVNGGRPGFDINNDFERWQQLPALACRKAIVVFIANDIVISNVLLERQKFINDLINIRQENLDHVYQREASGSRLLEWCRMKLLLRGITSDTVQWYLDCYSTANQANVLRLEQMIRRFAENPGFPTVFVLYPLLEGLEKGYPLQKIHDQVGAMLQSAGIPYLDLAPVFAGQETSRLWVHEVDHHPNGKAHHMAATAIVRWLKQDLTAFLDREPRPIEQSASGSREQVRD